MQVKESLFDSLVWSKLDASVLDCSPAALKHHKLRVLDKRCIHYRLHIHSNMIV